MPGSHIYGNIALVKTTVDLEAGLFKSARKLAIDQGRPFRAVLNDALRTYLGVGAATAPRPQRSRRKAPAGAVSATDGKTQSSEAEFWAIVNDRSRWDEMFGDRLEKIEADIARATADWEKRNRR
jgi:hypothetical protein